MVNLRQNYNFSKKQKAALCIMVAAGLAVSIIANQYHLSSGTPAAATASDATPVTLPDDAGLSFSGIHSSLAEIDDNETEDSFQAAADKLNLCYFYAADADKSDVLNSYAGRVYQKLMTQDSQYIAGIYDLAGITPREMCSRLGISSSRVLGKYNPNASSQNADDSGSWYVPNFKNVNFTFYNADGERVSEYSNVKDIMAMASVYCYYHDYLDYDTFEKICLELYQKSRSYKVSIGNVYYDNGCIHKSAKEEAEDEISYEQESEGEEITLGGSESIEANLQAVTVVEDDANGNLTLRDSSGNELRITTIDGKQYVMEYEEADKNGRRKVNFTPVEEYAGGALLGSQETSGETAESEDYGEEIPLGTDSTTTAENASSAESSIAAAESSVEQTEAAEKETQQQTAAAETQPSTETQSSTETKASAEHRDDDMLVFSQMSYRGGSRAATLTSSNRHNGFVKTVANNNFIVYDEEESQSEAASQAAVENAGGADSAESESSGTSETKKDNTETADDPKSKNYCPGHVDLNVSITIYGFEDKNGLRALNLTSDDALDAEDAATENPRWQGWTEENIASVNALITQDWFKTYGLSISSLNPKSPLTEEEISAYIDKLPEDVSEERKTLVRYALSSVGKIPYYYGGKASVRGFEGNGFGTVTGEADYKGRILRGLDCSGWIQWVYWSALNMNLNGAASTANLIGCGERISRAELKPGDIVVRPGNDSHVVMFLCWADNGNMIAIHENSSANNVSVNEVTANYPYYRRLID